MTTVYCSDIECLNNEERECKLGVISIGYSKVDHEFTCYDAEYQWTK